MGAYQQYQNVMRMRRQRWPVVRNFGDLFVGRLATLSGRLTNENMRGQAYGVAVMHDVSD